ncbi:universal stress protein [Myxosarcina sp. GI1(2024)]
MFQSCLICTDFTDGLYRLVDCIPNLAQCGLKKIVFFHSVPIWQEGEVPRVDEEAIAAAKERLAKASENVPEGVEVKVKVASGKPLDTIPRVLNEYPVEVILIGTPIRSLLEEKFFGSTSMGLAKQTELPLTIIRPELITTYTREELALRCRHLWRYLLIPYNGSETARYAIDQIKAYARERPQDSLQQCMLIRVIENVGRQSLIVEERMKEARAQLESVKQELEELDIKVNTLVTQGNPLQEIAAAALDFDISAIAIADDYSNSLLQWTVRCFARDLIRSSWFPLLLFSPKK